MEQVHASMHMNVVNCTQKLMLHCTLFMPFSKNRLHFNSSTTVLESYTLNKIIELRQYTVMNTNIFMLNVLQTEFQDGTRYNPWYIAEQSNLSHPGDFTLNRYTLPSILFQNLFTGIS